MTASYPLEQTTRFALWMQQHAGPLDREMLRNAFLQEEIRFGSPSGPLLPTTLPCLRSLILREFEANRWGAGCRLLLVPDCLLEPGRLYRFSFWVDVEDSLVLGTHDVFCTIDRSRFFLFCQSRKAHGPEHHGLGRISYFVAVPEPTRWAMRILLLEGDSEIALFRSEHRSARSEPRPVRPKRRRKRAVRSER